jgi:hypothetical protein
VQRVVVVHRTMARPCEKKKRGGEEKWCFSLGFAKRQEGRRRKDIIHLILTKFHVGPSRFGKKN